MLLHTRNCGITSLCSLGRNQGQCIEVMTMYFAEVERIYLHIYESL